MKENKAFYVELFKLTFPITLQQFMLAAVSASDAFMLGFLSQDFLSAVALASQIQFIFNMFMKALTIATSILAAQYWGIKDRKSIEKVLGISLKVSMSISFVFFASVLLFPGFLMRIYTSDSTLIASGIRYLRIISVSYLLTGFSQIYLCILKNSGHTMKSSIISSSSVIINIILNAFLIFGIGFFPKMNVAGAALATVLAKCIEAGWLFVETMRKDRLKIRLSYLWKNDALLKKDFWRNAKPVLGNQVFWGFGFTINSVIMGHLGTDAVAAFSLSNIVIELTGCLSSGLASGGGILIGNELGRGQLDTAKRHGGMLYKLAMIIGVLNGLFVFALTPVVLHFSTLSPTANYYLKWLLIMCLFYMVGRASSFVSISGIFCAGGDSRFGLYCDTLTMWAFIVPLGLLSAFVLHLPVLAVLFILHLDEVIKQPAIYIHYKKYLWVKNLTREHTT